MSEEFAYPNSFDDVVKLQQVPAVAIDHNSFFTFVNEMFTKTYGWTSDELLSQAVTRIMPEHMRNVHMVGFSRFLVTEQPRIIGKPVRVSIVCKNNEIMNVELFIISDKKDGQWRFAAIINPLMD
ncbi:PAS domain S-box protein [Candidatus Saccharibacteria bacterium]|nr:PAS domain S-box protein [Candidatus Saccharibacteria bacterium]